MQVSDEPFTSLFYWIGVTATAIMAMLAVLLICALAIALWARFGPRIICRRPTALNIWSSYRADIRTGEGALVKNGPDKQITRLIGVSWRYRWFAGLMVLDDAPPATAGKAPLPGSEG